METTPLPPSLVDTKPYLFRQSPAQTQFMNDKIVGGTVAWNQLVENGNFVDSTGWTTGSTNTLTASGGVARLAIASGTSANNRDIRATTQKIVDNNHVYLVSFDALGTGAFVGGALQFRQLTDQITILDFGTLTATKKRYAGICKPTGLTDPSGSNYRRRIVATPTAVSIGDYFEISNFMSIDLTQMFGATIADYVNTLEQGHAGDGIAWLKSFGFFTEDYYPYDAGSLLSVKTSAHETVKGGITHTYPLSDIELRGIPKLTDGNIVYDGDTYESDGTVTRKYGVRAYQAGDESDSTVVTDMTNTVYPLVTPTTETTTPFENPQITGTTEEYIDTRTVPMPVGHETEYFDTQKSVAVKMSMGAGLTVKMKMGGSL